MFKRFIRWLSCKFGNHRYSPALMDFTMCDRRGSMGYYRVHTCCVFCGCPYDSIIAIRLPPSETGGEEVKKSEEGGGEDG